MDTFFTINYEGTNISKQLKDFATASIDLTLLNTEYIYVGYYKPFKQFYVELETPNINANIMTAEYYDGTVWQPLNTLLDESDGFTKSGFMFFEKPTAWREYQDLYQIRIKTDTDHSASKLQGLAILLSNDVDLVGLKSNIVTKFNNGSSWVLKHELARKDIMQLLRNKGNRVVKNHDNNNPLVTEGQRFADLNEFDLLEPEQLRQCALYKTMSMIYLDELSDSVEDKEYRRGQRYEKTFHEMFNLFYLQLDSDDDGLPSASENQGSTRTDLKWT